MFWLMVFEKLLSPVTINTSGACTLLPLFMCSAPAFYLSRVRVAIGTVKVVIPLFSGAQLDNSAAQSGKSLVPLLGSLDHRLFQTRNCRFI